jgi:hypothetical protein
MTIVEVHKLTRTSTNARRLSVTALKVVLTRHAAKTIFAPSKSSLT